MRGGIAVGAVVLVVVLGLVLRRLPNFIPPDVKMMGAAAVLGLFGGYLLSRLIRRSIARRRKRSEISASGLKAIDGGLASISKPQKGKKRR